MPASEGRDSLTFVVPGDPDQNTGGYRYVGRLVKALNELGHPARVVGVEGRFPRADDAALAAVEGLLATLADQSVVVLDGLAMGGMPEVVERHADRLVIIALVHHPLADETGLDRGQKDWLFRSEKRALASVRGVVATSDYTAARLADFGVDAARVRVARPGVDAPRVRQAQHAPAATGQEPIPKTVELLCVAHLSPRKAQLHLVEALAQLVRLPWHCKLIGSDQRDAGYSAEVKRAIATHQLEGRIAVTGELDAPAVDEAYRNADLFVFPSLYEGYGMAIDEALAAGLPVVTSDGGALARVAATPGVICYPAGDIRALEDQLAKLLAQPQRLAALQQAAQTAQTGIQTWAQTAESFLAGLTGLEQMSRGRGATRFEASWLALREPADHRARDRNLTAQLTAWMAQRYGSGHNPAGSRAPLAIADLGSGGGSNARYLVPKAGVPQHWTLLDQDAELMAIARERLAPLDMPLQAVVADLSPATLAEQIPWTTDLITASALIDLVSGQWLESLAECARARQAAVFVVLSYNGSFTLGSPEPDDQLILQLVNKHQHGDKGAGAAMGPGATGVLKLLLASRGYQVFTAESPWQLGPADPDLQSALLQGWCAAATEQAPAMAARIGQWLEHRQQQALNGDLSIQVGHQDLLALPPVDHRG